MIRVYVSHVEAEFFFDCFYPMGVSSSKKAQTRRLQDATIRDEVDLVVKDALMGSDGVGLETKIQISISTQGLDPSQVYSVVGYMSEGRDDWIYIGSTETSGGVSSISFVRNIVVDYKFETPQKIRLDLYKLEHGQEIETILPANTVLVPPNAHYMGFLECYIAEVLSAEGNRLTKKVAEKASMTVYIDELKILQNLITFDVKVTSLLVGPSGRKPKARSVYFSMYRGVCTDQDDESKNASLPQVVKSEPISISPTLDGFLTNMSWLQIHVSANSVCRGIVNQPIVLEIWESMKKGNDKRLSSGTTTYTEIQKSFKSGFPVEVGNILLSNVKIERRESFLDYVSQGLQISLFIAVDFTKSNKDSHLPDSLHYQGGPVENDYLKAIRSVVDILEHYDSDKKFPMYGFGARLPPSYTHCSHSFACNGDFFEPEVVGVDGVLEAYRKAVSSVVFHGPTNFHEIITLVGNSAAPYSQPKPGQLLRYSILLILTDGVITDMKETMNALVKCADYPVSVIIVGVGEEDFGLMEMLDADDKKLFSAELHRFAQRDIVQFVPFGKFKDSPITALARETLEEIPREVVDYFKNRGILPGNQRLEEKSEQDPFTEILQKMKGELVASILQNSNENIKDDQMQIYNVINTDKIPACHPGYYCDVAVNGTRGSNVMNQRKHEVSRAPTADLGARIYQTVREATANSASRASTPQPYSEESPLDTNLPATVCKICFDRTIDTVLLPCAHSLLCQLCASAVTDCPICRKSVSQVVRTFAT